MPVNVIKMVNMPIKMLFFVTINPYKKANIKRKVKTIVHCLISLSVMSQVTKVTVAKKKKMQPVNK